MVSIVLECDECHSKLTIEDTLVLNSADCDGWFMNIDEVNNTAYCLCPACDRKMMEDDDKYIEYNKLSKLL